MPASFPVPIVLASASPRRKALLEEYGYKFTVDPALIDEVSPTHLTPRETVLLNARAKCRAVAARHPGAIVLGVDTVVALGHELFGKPANSAAAFRMLSRLNGHAHEVFSGVWIAAAAKHRERGFVEMSRVHFRSLSDDRLRAYLARIAPLDKAGAYAAQDDEGELIEAVDGSYSNVIGLPMERLSRVLREFARGPL